MPLRVVFASIAVSVFAVVDGAADEFLLTGGGRIDGRLVNVEQSPRTSYVVELASGGTVMLGKDQVREVVRRTADEIEYEKIRHEQPDTVAGQWALAEWCKERKLADLRKRHLERVVELDPNHRDARAALGYNRLGGQWRTRDEHQTALGKVLYKGQYRYPQEIEIIESREKSGKERQQWYANLKRWREWLAGDKAPAAAANIADITDPAALPALREYLDAEQDENVRKLYVEAAGRIGTAEADMLLAERSIGDPSEEIRETCLDLLAKNPQHSLVTFYIQSLRSQDNNVVNRAAMALRRFKDPRSIAPLIDALVTKHKFKVTTGSANPGAVSATSGSLGSGLSMGQSTTIVTQNLSNQAVLDTLVIVTGGTQNFRFDVAAWKQWYAGQKKNHLLDIRRG